MADGPYPRNARNELSSSTRGRGLGYTFKLTKPAITLLLILVLFASIARTVFVNPEGAAALETLVLFAKSLAVVSGWAGILMLGAYIFFQPYQVYDRVASFFSRSGGVRN
jgi:hypothetical protein